MSEKLSGLSAYMEHLIELRQCIMRALMGIAVVLVPLLFFRESIYLFVATPLIDAMPEGANLVSLRAQDNFLTPIRLVIWLSFYFTIPWTLYQLWSFVAPGLYHNEKRIAFPILISSILLFYLGVLFAYYVVLPIAFKFFMGQQLAGTILQQDINQLISLILLVFFAFGLAFEVPIIVIILVILRVVSTERIGHLRPYIIIGAFVVGAIVTPPDFISQIIFATIVLILFEIGLWFAKRIERSRKPTLPEESSEKP